MYQNFENIKDLYLLFSGFYSYLWKKAYCLCPHIPHNYGMDKEFILSVEQKNSLFMYNKICLYNFYFIFSFIFLISYSLRNRLITYRLLLGRPIVQMQEHNVLISIKQILSHHNSLNGVVFYFIYNKRITEKYGTITHSVSIAEQVKKVFIKIF